jgi:uncharacterized protein YkwD
MKLVHRVAALVIVPLFAAGAAVAVTPTPASAVSPSVMVVQVVALTNKYRAGKCAKVKVNSRLATSARAHSYYQAKRSRMTHTGSGGTNFVTRAKRSGYTGAISENVAWGQTTAAKVVRAWILSPGHRANIMNCKARSVGVGVGFNKRGVPFWTQVFGRV